jgi:hypothetical protein
MHTQCSLRRIDGGVDGDLVHIAVLLMCDRCVTRVLQECHKSITRVLQECHKCHKSVTRVSQECSNLVLCAQALGVQDGVRLGALLHHVEDRHLQGCYRGVTVLPW